MIKVTKVKDDLPGFTGFAALYQLSEPVEFGWQFDDDDPPLETTEYVIISAAIAMITGPETYIFPANENGDVIDWGEMSGSRRGTMSHEEVIAAAGWILD